jgi:diacylglycerol kinase (ATP)
LLINPSAGHGRVNVVIQAASRHFKEPQWRLLVKVLTSPEEAYVLTRDAVRRGYYAVVVAGGDGTINEVARALSGKKTALGIIPVGTGNGFARDLGIPLDPEKACANLLKSTIHKIDLGSLNEERVFVSICGAGFDAWAARRANEMRWINRVSGFMRYLVSGITTTFEFKPQQLRVRVDAESYEGPCLLVTVANGEQYGFGATIAPGAILTDGKLDVVILPPVNPVTLVRNVIRLYTKKPFLGGRRMIGKKISIQSMNGAEPPLHVDGETTGLGPAKIHVLPRALSVLLP